MSHEQNVQFVPPCPFPAFGRDILFGQDGYIVNGVGNDDTFFFGNRTGALIGKTLREEYEFVYAVNEAASGRRHHA